MTLYKIQITNYNSYSDKTEKTYAYTFANNLAELGERIESIGLDYIENISIEVINSDCTPYVLYIPTEWPENNYKVVNETNDY